MRAIGRAIGFRMPMCSSRVLLGLESSARTQLRNHRSRADVFESIPVGGCKYERYVQYASTDEHLYPLWQLCKLQWLKLIMKKYTPPPEIF